MAFRLKTGYGLPSEEPSLAPLSQHSSNVRPSSQGCNHATQKSSNESLENFGSGDGTGMRLLRPKGKCYLQHKAANHYHKLSTGANQGLEKITPMFSKEILVAGIESRFPNSLGTREKGREPAKEELTAAKRSLVMRVYS